MVNKPLIRPAISGGGTLGGGRLTSHDYKSLLNKKQLFWGKLLLGCPRKLGSLASKLVYFTYLRDVNNLLI